jgi:hypothetical protein
MGIDNLRNLSGVTIGKLRELIQFAVKCEEAAHAYFRPALHHVRYSIISMLDKLEAKVEGDAKDIVLKPMHRVVEKEGEAEDDETFRKRMTELELDNGEHENGKDWAGLYLRYVDLKNKGDVNEMQLEVF